MAETKKTNSEERKATPRRMSSHQRPQSDSDDEMRSLNTIKRVLDNFLLYYTRSEDPGYIIKDPESSLFMNRLLIQLGNLINQNKKTQSNMLDMLANDRLIKNFTNLLTYCFVYLKAVLSKTKTGSLGHTSTQIVENFNRVYDYLLLIMELIWGLTNFSIKFRTKFHQGQGSKVLLNFLNDPGFTDYYILFNVKHKVFGFADENYELMKKIIGSLHNLTKTSEFENTLNATHILITFAHKIKSSQLSINLISVYMTLSHIVKDKEIDEMADIFEIVDNVMRLVSSAADQIESSSECPRVKVDLEDDRVERVCAVSDEDEIKWDFVELMAGLYRIAVNDKIKYYIYVNCNFNKIVYKILTYGNVVEQEFCVRILYQMSFDEKICEIVVEDERLLALVKHVIATTELNESSSKLLQYCNNLNWLLDNNSNKTIKYVSRDDSIDSEEKSVSMDSSRSSEVHVDKVVSEAARLKLMISYNKENRDLCLKMKECLEKLNFNIWIDVEQIHGSSLESMAKAIEESDAIIICMTEKYKMSPNCRAEAEYTFNIRKKYIPCIMQVGYKPDGWLGLLLGAKIFIDFTKYPFQEAMDKLSMELSQQLKSKSKKLSSVVSASNLSSAQQSVNTAGFSRMKSSGSSDKISLIGGWSNDQVCKWLAENKCSEKIRAELKRFDGKMLCELGRMRYAAPEYFYRSMEKRCAIDFFDLVYFSSLLASLFD